MTNFQILDIQSDDIMSDNEGSKEFIITLYGRTDKDKKVVYCLKGFYPYFYIKVPSNWLSSKSVMFSKMERLIKGEGNSYEYYFENYIKSSWNHDPKIDLHFDECEGTNARDFYGFRCDENGESLEYSFVKLVFNSFGAMNKYVEAIKEMYSKISRKISEGGGAEISHIALQWFEQEITENCDSNLYEANIHPIIRFIHKQKIEPCGWVSIDHEKIHMYYHKLFSSHDAYEVPYQKVKPLERNDIHGFKIASFDLECDSSHGDFPVAKKDCKKLANDLYDNAMRFVDGQFDQDSDEEVEDIGAVNKITELIDTSLDKTDENSICSLHTKQAISRETRENASKELIKNDTIRNNLESRDKKQRDKTINLMNDILNKYLIKKDNYVLPDKIIQIGTVVQKYGETYPERRHILVIGPSDDTPKDKICEDIPEVQNPVIEVVQCESELELLLEWSKFIKETDPDFITGYNIFGFDFAYLNTRIKELCDCKSNGYSHGPNCPVKKFYNMGNIDSLDPNYNEHFSKKCGEKKQNLSSSGLGDNNLNYITMDGRILYDLQKEIQKSHNLESYKLDDVASHFIRGNISDITYNKRIKVSRLYTSDIGNLKNGDYISLRYHSNIGEKLYNNGEKLYIKQIIFPEDDDVDKIYEIQVTSKIESWSSDTKFEGIFKYEWCLNKDDVSPKDIFHKHQHGTARDRADIAKYCIQDCELCINLSLSLEIITNGVSMANVCFVPLSYIYLRGQGAKVYSIVVKECEKQGVMIPTLKRLTKPYDYTKFFLENGRDETKELLIIERYSDRYAKKYVKSKKDELIEELESNNMDFIYEIEFIDKYDDLKDNVSYIDYLIYTIENGKDKKDHKKYGDELEVYNIEYEEYLLNKRNGSANYTDRPKKIKEPRQLPYKDYQIEDRLDEIENPPPREGYEGAIVLDPKPGIYLDDPVSVLDYASLYPSSIIEKNLSHETLIEDPKYLKYVEHETIDYDNYEYVEKGKSIKKVINEEQKKVTCNFKKKEEGKPLGIIPTVLNHLLTQRKSAKKMLKNEPNEFKKKVWDGLQLAYKVTANSVYGQMGARTSPIYKNKIAACTTSIGRSRIDDASRGVVNWAKEKGIPEPEVIYGDTDSVFVKFSRMKDGKLLEGKEALEWCIKCGDEAGQWITEKIMREPQVLEYEKTFYPFILISKKRYIGDKYEFNPNKCSRTSMGIVMKRRDNAPIVKHVFGNMIEKIMVEKDFDGALKWIQNTLEEIRNGKLHMNEYIITKSLRGYYKNPGQIAHKVLADRIAIRDPGNKPKASDRIPFVYFKLPKNLTEEVIQLKNGKTRVKKKKVLQGERIELPSYVIEKGLELDFEHYIQNQVKNPVKQVLELKYSEDDTENLKKLEELFTEK